MPDFQFLVLGVGNAFSALHYSSCLALQAEGSWLLIDCPHPIRKILREASLSSGLTLDAEDISAVILTHLHGDHASGLEGFGYYCHYGPKHGKARIAAHPEVSAQLWKGHLAGGMEWSRQAPGEPPTQRSLEDFFELQPLSESEPLQIGPFSVECRRTLHSIPTTALRIHAAGRTLGYSADTTYDPSLIAWLAQSDLVIHETGEGGLHTPYAELAALPEDLQARMRLIHYPDHFDGQASVIEPLQQGRCYQV